MVVEHDAELSYIVEVPVFLLFSNQRFSDFVSNTPFEQVNLGLVIVSQSRDEALKVGEISGAGAISLGEVLKFSFSC